LEEIQAHLDFLAPLSAEEGGSENSPPAAEGRNRKVHTGIILDQYADLFDGGKRG
jgi:hypothetical protein